MVSIALQHCIVFRLQLQQYRSLSLARGKPRLWLPEKVLGVNEHGFGGRWLSSCFGLQIIFFGECLGMHEPACPTQRAARQ